MTGDDKLKNTLDALAADADRKWGSFLFTYCECPACQYSLVIETADLEDGTKKVACPLCWLDNQNMVAMTERAAREADSPEGPDARYLPLANYTCAKCGRQCLSSVDDSDARREFEEDHGIPFDAAKHPPICDDCFKALRHG